MTTRGCAALTGGTHTHTHAHTHTHTHTRTHAPAEETAADNSNILPLIAQRTQPLVVLELIVGDHGGIGQPWCVCVRDSECECECECECLRVPARVCLWQHAQFGSR